MSDTSARSRAVLEEGRRALALSLEHRARMREAILARVATNTAPPEVAPESGVQLSLKAHAGKVLGMSLIALVAGLTAWSNRSLDLPAPAPPRDAPVVEARVASAPVTPTPEPATAPATDDIAPAPREVTEPARALLTSKVSAKAPPVVATSKALAETSARVATHGIEEEYKLIDAAYSAVSAEEWARALSLADAHAARFPRGQLVQQRERLRIEALVATDRLDEARSAAALFRQQFPNGILRPSVERALTEKPHTVTR